MPTMKVVNGKALLLTGMYAIHWNLMIMLDICGHPIRNHSDTTEPEAHYSEVVYLE